tara:strand:- start:13331 stop:13552 length:222 start_codon:yes stop_codon:yes gene_type:complete
MQNKAATNRFTFDAHGKKVYIGAKVYYRNKQWLLKDIEYLRWNSNQYLTLQDLNNKNKIINFILPNSVIATRR